MGMKGKGQIEIVLSRVCKTLIRKTSEMFSNPAILFVVFQLFAQAAKTLGHGRLAEPPGRATCWRYGIKGCVPNYTDQGLNCGGFANQQKHGGKCGVCGDPYQGPRMHEAGGSHAKGVIVRTYKRGATIKITPQITANHGGWFEFSICAVNDKNKRAEDACFKKMTIVQSGTTRWTMPRHNLHTGNYDLQVRLPSDLTCSQCVIQWRWNCASNWGCDSEGCGMGHGPQEQFMGCADVAIE